MPLLCFAAEPGTYAEYALAHEDSVLPIPEGWSFNEAAAVPLAAMTAWQVGCKQLQDVTSWLKSCSCTCALDARQYCALMSALLATPLKGLDTPAALLCLLLQAMQPSMPLQGKRVLVHAGAGGVGSFAIQVCKHACRTQQQQQQQQQASRDTCFEGSS
jgi:NADPH:quinone reductase-like Zn-dependent oxidoreductase